MQMGEEGSRGRVYLYSKLLVRGTLESSRQGGQHRFLAGLLSHVPAGWFGAGCSVNPLGTCQTSVDTVAGAKKAGGKNRVATDREQGRGS